MCHAHDCISVISPLNTETHLCREVFFLGGISQSASIADFWHDQRGASAAEYVMLLAVLATGISVSLFMLSDSIGGAISNSAETISASGCSNQGQGTGLGGGNGGGDGQGAGQGVGNTC